MKNTTAPETAQIRAESPAPANYQDLYGLSKPPFGGAADSAGYILFGSHRRPFELLIDHLVNGSGVVLLFGEEGVGKTEILRSAASVAAESGLPAIMVSRPPDGRLSLAQLLSALSGQSTDQEIATETAIKNFLTPPRKVLLVDDLDLMPANCVRVLSSLAEAMPADPGGPAVVLTSSTDLTADTSRPDLSPVLAVARNSIRMSRLGPAEVRQYIERSLWIAGGATRRLITADAMKLLVARSGGVPGTINRLMEAAFTAGFARGDAMITAKTVAAATGRAAARPRRQPDISADVALRAMQIVAIGLLLTGASAFLYKGLNGPGEHPPSAPAKPVVAAKSSPPPAVVVVATPPQPQPVVKPVDKLPPELTAALMKRGSQLLDLGDIAAARLLFQRAAEAGNAAAATALGKTYDRNYMAPGGTPDLARATEWYRKAVALGDPRAADFLKKLGNR